MEKENVNRNIFGSKNGESLFSGNKNLSNLPLNMNFQNNFENSPFNNLDPQQNFTNNYKSVINFDQDFKKNFILSNTFSSRKVMLNFDINELNNVFQTNQNENKKSLGILDTKRCFHNESKTDDFISSLSSYNLTYNVINDKGIHYIKSFSEHTDRINDFSIIEKHSAFCSVASDGFIKIWDLKGDTKSVKTFNTGKEMYSCSTFDDYLCVGVGKDIVVWDLRTMKPISKVNFLHSENILSTKISMINNKPVLITGGDDNLVNVVDLSKPKITLDSIISTINTGQTVLKATLIGESELFLKTFSSSESISLWNLENNTEIIMFDPKNEELDITFIIDYDSSNFNTNINSKKQSDFTDLHGYFGNIAFGNNKYYFTLFF